LIIQETLQLEEALKKETETYKAQVKF
jgi:hypothetical protein